jgi:hypothetical protein
MQKELTNNARRDGLQHKNTRAKIINQTKKNLTYKLIKIELPLTFNAKNEFIIKSGARVFNLVFK